MEFNFVNVRRQGDGGEECKSACEIVYEKISIDVIRFGKKKNTLAE